MSTAIGNQIKTVVLLGALSGLLLAVGYMIGGYSGLTFALIFAFLLNFGTYWFSDKIVIAMYRAKEAPKSSDVYGLVSDVARRAKIPMPKVYTIPSMSPNAFATGRDPEHSAVVCSEGIIQLLTHDELKGVIAHEIAHIRNRDTLIATVAATIAAVISYIATMARWAAIFGGFGDRDDRRGGGLLEFLVLAILTPIIATIIQLAISRSREYLADETGARIVGSSKGLADALIKIDRGVRENPLQFGNTATASLFIANPFNAEGLIGLFSTHPPIQKRVERLRDLKIK